jgi:branched-chain amino acid transport system substrate-binding protein
MGQTRAQPGGGRRIGDERHALDGGIDVRLVSRKCAVGVVLAVVTVMSVSFSTTASAGTSATPGVTAKEIKVGAVIGKTNPTGVPYEDVVTGAQARFDAVNKKGGVFGRELKVVKTYDDQTRASKDILAARSLTEEDKVFAALVATQTFAGADVFVKAGTPTFGYNIQLEWSNGPNLFGSYGSFNCPDCPSFSPAYAAKQVGAKRAAIFAYGSSGSSSDCAGAIRNAMDRWGPKVAVFDTSLAFGFSANDISGAVQAIKDNDVDFVATCMDLNGEVNIKKALVAAGIPDMQFYAPQGYDTETIDELGDELDGFTFPIQFIPFELAKGNSGMTAFVKAMKARKLDPTENLLVGWVGAGLLIEGIQKAGKSFTQESVVDAINGITDWTSDGMIAPVNWETAHGPAQPGDESCFAYVIAKDGEFVPVYGESGSPLVCFSANPYPATLDDPVYRGG